MLTDWSHFGSLSSNAQGEIHYTAKDTRDINKMLDYSACLKRFSHCVIYYTDVLRTSQSCNKFWTPVHDSSVTLCWSLTLLIKFSIQIYQINWTENEYVFIKLIHWGCHKTSSMYDVFTWILCKVHAKRKTITRHFKSKKDIT